MEEGQDTLAIILPALSPAAVILALATCKRWNSAIKECKAIWEHVTLQPQGFKLVKEWPEVLKTVVKLGGSHLKSLTLSTVRGGPLGETDETNLAAMLGKDTADSSLLQSLCLRTIGLGHDPLDEDLSLEVLAKVSAAEREMELAAYLNMIWDAEISERLTAEEPDDPAILELLDLIDASIKDLKMAKPWAPLLLCPNITSLDLRGAGDLATSQFLWMLQSVPWAKDLQELRVGWRSEFTNDPGRSSKFVEPYACVKPIQIEKTLKACPKLKVVGFAGCGCWSALMGYWRPDHIMVLRPFVENRNANLVTLDLSSVMYINDTDLVPVLQTHTHLENLSLRGTLVSDQSLAVLGSKLQKLNISCCHLVTQNGINSILANCPGIQELDLCYISGLEATCAISVADCYGSQLTMLGFGGFKMDDGHLIRVLSKTPGLRHLGIGGTQVTGEGISEIGSRCPELRQLNAHRLKQVSKAAIDSLIECCPKLTGLDLNDCEGFEPEEGIEELEAQFPYFVED